MGYPTRKLRIYIKHSSVFFRYDYTASEIHQSNIKIFRLLPGLDASMIDAGLLLRYYIIKTNQPYYYRNLGPLYGPSWVSYAIRYSLRSDSP